ncbi:MAG: RNA polymerase sigma factor region1.1 domain-containing protein, partial [Terriglobia bacterium]
MLAIEDKYDWVRQLILLGKERGYLLYDEVNDLLPADVHTSEEIDDVLSAFDDAGIEIVEEAPKKAPARVATAEVELDLTPGALEKTNDPVRMYLREMGTVPLLTREGEVAIAKRIERGQLWVLKALSRTPLVIKEVIALGDELRKGEKNIKEIAQFHEDELTDDRLVEKTRRAIRARWQLARMRVEAGQLVRSIQFSNTERKRLMECLRSGVEELAALEREVARLGRRVEVGSLETAREARRELREVRARLRELETAAEVSAEEL